VDFAFLSTAIRDLVPGNPDLALRIASLETFELLDRRLLVVQAEHLLGERNVQMAVSVR